VCYLREQQFSWPRRFTVSLPVQTLSIVLEILGPQRRRPVRTIPPGAI
jgi:hypothetical protein